MVLWCDLGDLLGNITKSQASNGPGVGWFVPNGTLWILCSIRTLTEELYVVYVQQTILYYDVDSSILVSVPLRIPWFIIQPKIIKFLDKQ